MTESYTPIELNLGKPCSYWSLGALAACCYPKDEIAGRTTCLGVIDDICLYCKDGRPIRNPISLILMQGVKTSAPNSSLLPPGQLE